MVLVITFIGPRKESNKIILTHTLRHNHRTTSLRWIKSFLYYKMDKKSIVNDLYQVAVISVLAVGYLMLGKKYCMCLHQAFKCLTWKTQENWLPS